MPHVSNNHCQRLINEGQHRLSQRKPPGRFASVCHSPLHVCDCPTERPTDVDQQHIRPERVTLRTFNVPHAKRSRQLKMRRDPKMQDLECEYEGLIRCAFETDKECVTGRINRHQANAC